jgi:ACS family D-galactonate transporter-like MFS transporter
MVTQGITARLAESWCARAAMNHHPRVENDWSNSTATTRLRWRLVLTLMLICFMAHFNRVAMAVAGDARIMDEYQISPTMMGTVYSAFLAAYTLFMIPGGWLIDRRGPRFALQLVCFGSALFVVLTGCVAWLATSGKFALGAFIAVRSLMGIVSAPLHPASAKAVSLNVPAGGRSAANGLITGSALLGVASTYVLFGRLVDWLQWPAAFIVAGLMTAGVGWLWSRNALREANTSNESALHRDRARSARFEQHPQREASIWSFARRNKNLLLLTSSYAAVGYFQYLFFYWMHYYFETVLRLGAHESRFYSSIPPLAMALAMPLGGWISDRIETAFSWRAARAGLAIVTMASSAGLLLLGTLAVDVFWIVTWLSLALGVLGMAEGPFWVTAIEVGRRGGGLSAGIFNTGGNAGGILAPVVTPWISETLGFGWQTGIAVGSAVCLVGAALWYWIDLDRPDDCDERQILTSSS